jgi:hypothetical protein
MNVGTVAAIVSELSQDGWDFGLSYGKPYAHCRNINEVIEFENDVEFFDWLKENTRQYK